MNEYTLKYCIDLENSIFMELAILKSTEFIKTKFNYCYYYLSIPSQMQRKSKLPKIELGSLINTLSQYMEIDKSEISKAVRKMKFDT